MPGPVPSAGEQAIILVVAVAVFVLNILLFGSVGVRWFEALKRVPGAYRRGRDEATDDGDDE
jgi:hypothetical protein